MSADGESSPIARFVSEVPRTREAYALSRHASDRLRYRRDPEVQDWILEEVIEEGDCWPKKDLEEVSLDGDAGHRFVFEQDVWSEGLHNWRVVVEIFPQACLDDDLAHEIVTAFCKCHLKDVPDCEVEDARTKVVR